MELSAAGSLFIREHENCVLTPHFDAVAGVWDIGYGHRFKPGEPRVPITQAEADALFTLDVHYREDTVNEKVLVPLLQQQFDALVSFVYNVGHTAFETSTLLKKVNAALFDSATIQLLQWNKSRGKKVRGLCSRRYDEAMVFAYGDYSYV